MIFLNACVTACALVYVRAQITMFMFSLYSMQCPPPPTSNPAFGCSKIALKGLGTFCPYKQGQINNVSVEGATLHMRASWRSVFVQPKGGRRGGGVRVEVIALQALKCPVVLRTLGGHCATQLQSSGEGRARGWGRAERSHKRLSCKYKSLLAPEQRVQSSWTGFCFSLVLAPCQSAFCTERLGTLINLWLIPHRPDRERWILKNTMTLSHYNSK